MDFRLHIFLLLTLASLKTITAQFSESTFYKTCANPKVLCFGLNLADPYDDHCVGSKKCDLVVSVFEDPKYPKKVRFQLMGKPPPAQDVNFLGSYVAVGLSQDEWMGDDSVVECILDKKARIYTSWNSFRENKRLSDKSYISNEWVSYKNNTLFCDFTRNVKSTVEKVTFNLEDAKGYHVLLAMGNLAPYPEDQITQHTHRIVSASPILNDKSIVRHEPPHFSGAQIPRTSSIFIFFLVLIFKIY